ncbi:type VII secretion system-associated protein [Nocardia sp. NRRL S-836]|uniref:type VII secretion system-associated protein n=1 Tax=Nocardia sp. NRRL S-836 TaxID=1519492 RepID=UPI0006AF3F0F|nr:type VII secretion system-associated protein [Nocardia sp. NRRL S-836]
MNREEVLQKAWDWIVRTHGAASEGFRILTDDVVLVRGQWYVPYDAVDDVLVPLPAVEVPDDGGEPHAYVPAGPPSPWKRGVPRGNPGPGLSIVDPEWDQEAFAHLGVPSCAILGWLREEGSDEFRPNSEHTIGPGARGWPLPQTPADKVYAYYQCGWLDEDASFLAGLLDVVVYTADEVGQDENGRTWLAAYTSERLLPPGIRRWRGAGVRELITTTTADEVRINPGHALQTPLGKDVPLDRWPAPFDLPAFEREEQGSPALLQRVDEARAHEFVFTDEERSTLAEALRWHENGRPDPLPSGVQRTWDSDGAPAWQVPTFGKASGFPATQPNGWPWVAGVYAGFALDGNPHAAGLFKLTDNLVRAVAQRSPRLAAEHPWLPRREDWLPNAPEPAREVLALVAGLGAGHPAVRSTGWDDEISPVFARAVSRDAFSRAPHYILQELGMPWPDSTTPWGQAVRIVSTYGHHPATALEMVKVPLVRALVGALLGAWHGIPGLPGSDDRDLAECVATEAFLAFDPKYAPVETTHPGLPPISDGMRAEALKSPGGWLYCADPDIDPRYIEGAPLHTLLGAYEIGADGQFTGQTWVNDEYRPSPRRLGLPAPENEFEEVLNLVTAGWLPYEAILSAALESELLVPPAPDGGLAVLRDEQGNNVLAVYSSPRYLPADAGTPERWALKELLSALPGLLVLVNPGGRVGADLVGDHLVQLFTGSTG